MNFLADESVDRQVVGRLREDGHLVRYVAEMEPGISDDAVLELANRDWKVASLPGSPIAARRNHRGGKGPSPDGLTPDHRPGHG
ncbi:MAG: DUF5615 family PIN-like protein [candidate division NC10 bacterium]|nr:DUF5615 family PIN-like protein [candidate division NC10 bacterium]